MCKRCQNIFIGLKKTCLGVLDRGERGDNNGTGLKEGGGIEMSTTVLPLRDARSLRFEYLPIGLIYYSYTFTCTFQRTDTTIVLFAV